MTTTTPGEKLILLALHSTLAQIVERLTSITDERLAVATHHTAERVLNIAQAVAMGSITPAEVIEKLERLKARAWEPPRPVDTDALTDEIWKEAMREAEELAKELS